MNKTLFFSAAILLAVAFSTPTVAATKAELDANFKFFINNFTTSNDGRLTSGIVGGTAESKNVDSDVVGLVFAANLGVTTSGPNSTGGKDSIGEHWGRVVQSDDAFLIKVCKDGTNECYLNTIPYTNNRADPAVQAFSQTDVSGTPADKQTLPVSVFSKAARNTGDLYTFDPSTNTASPANNVVFKKATNYTASFWYCAVGGSAIVEQYKTNNISTISPTTFGNICGGFGYFQIGTSLPVAIPADVTAIDQQTTASASTIAGGSAVSSSEGNNLPACGIESLGSSGTINGCIARIAYGLYVLVAWIAGILGSLFDFFLGYSLSDTSYRYDFAVTGWKLVRDISNIFFIIIMVWTGFSAVFDTSKTGSMRKIIPQLIINAIFINFSLFGTRVIIDLSNITARMFYSQMVVCDQVNIKPDGKCDPTQAKRGPGGYWPLSEKIVSAFNPQTLFKVSTLIPPDGASTGSRDTSNAFDPQAISQDSSRNSPTDYANYFMVVCIVAALIMGVVGIMFFKVAFLFVGRVVGLYICMIFAPFAVLSREMPMFGRFKQLKWTDWLSDLTKYALLAPVFVFFLYIIYSFLSSDFIQQIGYKDSTGSFMGTILAIIIPMAIIFFLLKAAQDAAESFAGEIGKRIQGYGTALTGLAVGAASGGTALLASRTLGGLAKRTDESRVGVGIRNLAAKSGIAGFAGRTLQRGLNAGRSGSYDVRQSGLGQQVFSRLGLNTNQKALNTFAGSGLGLGTDQRKGGFEADIKRREEKKAATEKLFEEKGAGAIAAYNEKNKARYDKQVTAAVEAGMIAMHGQALVDAAKAAKDDKTNPNSTLYDQYRKDAIAQTATQAAVSSIAAPKQVDSADKLTSARRKTYAEGLKKGGYFTQMGDWAIKQAEEKGGAYNILGAGAELLRATAGAAIGSGVRTEGSRKAAKKLEEKGKAEKELENIESTLKKGFQDLIAVERFNSSSSFTTLPPEEQRELLTTGVIQQNGPNKGKRMFDILTSAEQAEVTAQQIAVSADKQAREQLEKRVQANEQSRYNMNELKKDKKRFQKDATDPGKTPQQKQDAWNDYFRVQNEIDEATKHQKIWSDIGKYQEEQKKKLKDEEKK